MEDRFIKMAEEAVNPIDILEVALDAEGLIIFFPICEDKLIVIYDDGMYLKFGEDQYVTMCDEDEVKHLNIMQYFSAENVIYAKNKKRFRICR